MLKQLEYKKEVVEFFNRKILSNNVLDAFNARQFISDEKRGEIVSDFFFEPDETFDAQKAARMMSDYEISLLADLIEDSECYIRITQGNLIELVKNEVVIKTYDSDHSLAFSWLTARNLVLVKEEIGLKTKTFKFVMPRSGLILEAARKISDQDIENLELWTGMPSLYRCNDIVGDI
jgi:hypothetical protein